MRPLQCLKTFRKNDRFNSISSLLFFSFSSLYVRMYICMCVCVCVLLRNDRRPSVKVSFSFSSLRLFFPSSSSSFPIYRSSLLSLYAISFAPPTLNSFARTKQKRAQRKQSLTLCSLSLPLPSLSTSHTHPIFPPSSLMSAAVMQSPLVGAVRGRKESFPRWASPFPSSVQRAVLLPSAPSPLHALRLFHPALQAAAADLIAAQGGVTAAVDTADGEKKKREKNTLTLTLTLIVTLNRETRPKPSKSRHLSFFAFVC